MAIIRDLNNSKHLPFPADNTLAYLSTVALFCGISCTILMLRFRGFRASLNLTSGKASGAQYELAPQVSVTGAYRTSRDEFFGNIDYLDSRRKITPSMVKLPHSTEVTEHIKPSKSTGDLSKVKDLPVEVRKSTPNVSVHNHQSARETKDQLKAQKKLEKQRLAEEKKREKLAAQERAKQDKLKKEREKRAAKDAKQRQRNKAIPAPQTISQETQINTQLPPRPTSQRVAQKGAAPPPPPLPPQPNENPLSAVPQYSTNTLDSSISRSSGPPPYSPTKVEPNKKDNTGNTSFKTSEASSSWDMITQHRQQMNRATGVTAGITKQKRLDLRYDVGNVTRNDRDNSDA